MFMLTTDTPILEVYYAATCAPCRQEIPLLTEVSASTRLVIYVLDKAASLDKLPARIVITAPADPRRVLRQAGDQDGILPFARSVRADGTLCGTWRGKLTLNRIDSLINLCRGPERPLP